MSGALLNGGDFPDFGAAADHARDAAIEAHDFMLVVSLALSTGDGHLTLASQEAVHTAAIYAVEKVKQARDAIDLAGGMFRTSGKRR